MIKHYCDRCGKEVAELKDLQRFRVTPRKFRETECEMCKDCFREIFPEISKEISSREAEKETKEVKT